MSIKLRGDESPNSVSDKVYKVLQDQGQLPSSWPLRPELTEEGGAIPLEDRANTGTVNTANLSTEALEAELERRRAAETIPTIGDKGGIQSESEESESKDEDVDYDEGWTNAQRQAELSERNLSIDGNKAELIARLLRSDADELTEEDTATAD